MSDTVLTNLLLTGILLVQCYAIIFRDARRQPGRKEDTGAANNPVKFPLS